MKIMNIKKYNYPTLLLFTSLLLGACDDNIKLIGDPVTKLSNECIKRSLPVAPNLVGYEIEFAYAMAIPPELGKLESAQVTASFGGAKGTYFDPNSYSTGNSGLDVPVLVANESATSGNTTSISFIRDTCAATLRYYYIIPEEARGKEVNFTFSVKASNGQTAEYKMGPYAISKMDMTLEKKLTSGEACYLSFRNEGEAFSVYSAEEVAANSALASRIDLVYAYNSSADLTHGFFAADSPEAVRPGVVFPSGFSNQTRMIKVYSLRDRQLSNLNNSQHIDDLDFRQLDYGKATSNAVKMVAEGGLWLETADGQYRAFIFINATATDTVTISAKRYKM
jgi:hypothetical protein